MGYLTSVMVYNDMLEEIRNDTEFGQHLWSAVLAWNGRTRSRTRLQIGRHQSCVVSQAHADHPQIVMLWRNSAYAFSDHLDPHVTDEMIDFAIKELKNIKRYRARKTEGGEE